MNAFRFYLITDRHQARQDPAQLLPELARAGLRALQIREKDLPPDQLAGYCATLREALAGGADRPAIFLNDRADIALAMGLDGVHLRESSLPLARQALSLREALRWGVSTHTLAGVQAAEAAGAEFVTFGPVYDTPSKAGMGGAVGLAALAKVAAAVKIPVLALGGVTPERCRECLDAGAAGVAAIGAIWQAEDPVTALKAFAEALGGL